jgi:hypothetical protein
MTGVGRNISKNLLDKKFSIQFLPEILIDKTDHKHFYYKDKKLKSSYLIDIVHNLILKYYFRKENKFNISSLVLKEKYGHLYNYYMDYLVEFKVISVLKKHMKGKNARIYKLVDDVLRGKITRYKNDDKVLVKKYRNAVSKILFEDIRNNKILPEIKQKLVEDLYKVSIDYSRAIFYLDSTIQDSDIYHKNKYSVECIENKHIFYHFDNYGRMHTNFTILKSFIRKNCLYIGGEETFEIDIKNSQPLFLVKLIENNDSNTVDPKELELFKYLTKNGNFYQYIIDNSKIKEKKKVKDCIYKVLFGKNYKNKQDELFKELFPTIYDFIKIYKKNQGDYRILAYNLQNLESEFIFNKVIKSIISYDPNIPIFTVHDSIISTIKHKEFVTDTFNQIMSKEFENSVDVESCMA